MLGTELSTTGWRGCTHKKRMPKYAGRGPERAHLEKALMQDQYTHGYLDLPRTQTGKKLQTASMGSIDGNHQR